MKTVFRVEHSYEPSPDCEAETKYIGIFETRKDAERVVSLLQTQPGFSSFPDHFEIHEETIGVIGWQEGFITETHTPKWEVWASNGQGLLSRIKYNTTENEALQYVRTEEPSGGFVSYHAKEVR